MNRMTLLSLLAASLLAACGGDDTRYRDRVIEVPGEPVENPVEYMPVDGFVLGFWVMDQDDACDSFCLNDYSAYGSPLFAADLNHAPLAQAPVLGDEGAIGGVLPFTGDWQASTQESAVFSNTLIGERFAIHLRARTSEETLRTVLSLGTASGTAMNIQLARQSLVAEFPRQAKRLLVSLDDAADWQEIQLAADGERVTLQVGCTEVASFDRVSGAPILSTAPTRAMLGARWGSSATDAFTGEVDVLRISRQTETNLFCAE